jgi:hypothetical protein
VVLKRTSVPSCGTERPSSYCAIARSDTPDLSVSFPLVQPSHARVRRRPAPGSARTMTRRARVSELRSRLVSSSKLLMKRRIVRPKYRQMTSVRFTDYDKDRLPFRFPWVQAAFVRSGRRDGRQVWFPRLRLLLWTDLRCLMVAPLGSRTPASFRRNCISSATIRATSAKMPSWAFTDPGASPR